MTSSSQAKLSHLDDSNRPAMVDVSHKKITQREAVAEGWVLLPAEVAELFADNEIHMAKGPVFQTAIIAGTQAVKQTASLIPFCHPLALEGISLELSMEEGRAMGTGNAVHIRCRVKTEGKTGVEMEALTGATVAALTVYDMCKAVSHEIIIQEVRLVSKSGGKRRVGENAA